MSFRSREYEDLQDFHAKFGMYHNRRPGLLESDFMQFRLDFLKEELHETVLAAGRGDLAEVADGLVDLVYVAIGTAELMGLPWADLWAAVQRANMAKIRAIPGKKEGKRNSQFDIIKPDGWTPPNIHEVLMKVSEYDREAAIVRRPD